ncbi:DUF302 domain-containing protein [Leucothrix pacifica]|uniref:DUF302 domain-containing protein n=1 Tax=Leucothrix pacifica TaxID=1247513 RepID=A0A317CND0_9GAMM|nr:DUF302 domain-containing protein [Leucothrix pacifica]PWQ99829.1 hypothetical protein DKW60_04975 [Leucothrix pacifica]
MGLIRNILAIIGLIAILAVAYGYSKFGSELEALKALDPKARGVYTEMWQKLKENGDSASATVWKQALAEDVDWEDAEEAMRSTATELNIRGVGELPLSTQVELMTGEEQRFLKIYQFCNPQTAMKMVNYRDAFSAYLPCRIAMIEDKNGKYWLYALNMDMMIYGGKTLPPELLEEAIAVKEAILTIMERGANGDF